MSSAERIKFTCDGCGYLIRVPLSYAGKKGKCPTCKAVVRIPTAEAAAAADIPPTNPKPVQRVPESERPTKRMPQALKPSIQLPPAKPVKPAPTKGPKVHALVRLGAEPIRLVDGAPLVIGRSEQCDLTIPSPRVSRKHCQLSWRQGQPYLKDLGSQNGTLVNGKRIYDRALQDGDEIVVGPFLITYLCPQDPKELENALDVMVDGEMKTEFTLVDAMSGRIEEVTLFEVLQTLEFTKKTGTLEVDRNDGSSAEVGVDQGMVVFARLGQLSGLDAVFAVLEWDKGTFGFKQKLTRAAELKKPITAILLEAGRRMDERAG
jgi:pSer/pThr/pTyr-binding forkhead associated (FHA) protein